MQWDQPTKTFPTIKAIALLKAMELPGGDRAEMDWHLDELDRWTTRRDSLEEQIVSRAQGLEQIEILRTNPGVNDSGEGTGRRGRITKAGSPVVRWVMAQVTLHVLRRDPVMKAWYKPIKNRRGSKVARVAVMRKLCVIIRNMLVNNQDYFACRDAMVSRRKQQVVKNAAA